MPEGIEPMKATLAKLPSDDEGWGYEIKWDGVRAIAYVPPGHLTLESRNLREITPQYPEIGGITRALEGRPVVLDGELVAFDDDGRPSFQRLQGRMHVVSSSEVRRRMRDVPVTYVIFDVLHLDGETLFERPYEERRELLESLELDGESWQTPAYHRGEGAALLDASARQGLEGIVAKRLASPYRPGKRGRDWLKVKNVRSQEVVIGGWLPGKGRREGEIGALLVGYYDDDELATQARSAPASPKPTCGCCASASSRCAPTRARSRAASRRREAIFVRTDLVAQVEFAEWTNAGTLRHASYEGLRDDKPAADVVREEPAEA